MKKNNWYYLNSGIHDGSFNMNCDEFLLDGLINDHIELPILRVYGWSQPTLSIGANQKIDLAQSNPSFEFSSVPFVKRITGGMAVLHGGLDDELTYSLVIKTEKNFKKIYNEISKTLIYFLENYGLSGVFGYSNKNYFTEFNCFNSKTPADIVVNDVKVIGSAQYQKRGHVLQHGSIRLDLISGFLGESVDFFKAIESLKSAFQVKLNIDFIDYCISEFDMKNINNKNAILSLA